MKLKRSDDRYLAGVCGGIAEQFGVNPFLMRLMWAVVSLITFVLPGLIVYIVLWKTMDKPDE